MTLSQVAVKKQHAILMRPDCPNRVLDQKFPMPNSKLKIAVTAVLINNNEKPIGDPDRVVYSGITPVIVPHGMCLTRARVWLCYAQPMVWCGVVWCSVVWCGVMRRGAVWCGAGPCVTDGAIQAFKL